MRKFRKVNVGILGGGWTTEDKGKDKDEGVQWTAQHSHEHRSELPVERVNIKEYRGVWWKIGRTPKTGKGPGPPTRYGALTLYWET